MHQQLVLPRLRQNVKPLPPPVTLLDLERLYLHRQTMIQRHPPRKKAWISKRAQIPLSEVEGSLSSAPQWRVTLVVRPPREAPQKHAVPPAIRAEPSTNTPLPAPPIPPSHAHSPPLEPMPLRLSPVDPSNISYHRRLDDIIKRQDLIFGRVDEVDRWVADVAG
ncbi:hypothetical protein PISMIDRAFT_17740 [Pisolithus microcarpus 441]|uniref:Uncharacterized protein n=1 Tax=Pisolithus microcarpus 441 TaxID=765257 RepID=A0A0C9YU48_9AGAM|nr:hypothetical protein PISMIDRAFT_17740 [Pisolithus microcarpus 441]